MSSETKRFPKLLHPLVIVLLGVGAYATSFWGAFVLDDTRTIVENARIRHVLPRNARELLEPRSVGTLTFAINYAVGRLNPADYHLGNLMIHLAAALTLYGLVRGTLLLPGISEKLRMVAAALAFWAAALWTVHPLTTSCITYVSQRYEALMSLFYLLTLYAVLRGATSQQGKLWYLGGVMSCFFGMLTKEVMVTAPLAVLGYDYIFLARGFRGAVRARWGLYLGLFCTWAILVVSMRLGVPPAADAGEVYGRFPSFRYGWTQAAVIIHYLRLVFWPKPLCLDYRWPIVERLDEALPYVLAVVALLLATLFLFIRRSRFSFPMFLFFLLLAPTSSLVPRPDPAFEHRMYLPLGAILVAVVVGLYAIVTRVFQDQSCARRLRRIQVVLVCIATGVLFFLARMTFERNRVYASAELLWKDVLRTRPDNVRAYQNLATLAFTAGKDEEAVEFCEKGLGRLPDFGKMGREELLRLAASPEGEKLWRAAFDYSGFQNTLGLVRGRTDPTAAERHFREALRIAPGNLKARYNLALSMFRSGRYEEAIREWEELLKVSPASPDILFSLGEASYRAGRIGAARDYLEALLQHEPDHALALMRLAWILATAPEEGLRDGRRAVVLAEKAHQILGGVNLQCLDVLAAAYAEAAEFKKASQIAAQALRLTEHGKRTDSEPGKKNVGEGQQVEQIRERLRLYESGKPYRVAEPHQSKTETTNGRSSQ